MELDGDFWPGRGDFRVASTMPSSDTAREVSISNSAVVSAPPPALVATCCTLAMGLAACATASSTDENGGKPEGPDAAVPGRADATPGIKADAAVGQPDATPVTNPADAGSPIDAAAGCTPVGVNILTNADFDLGPGSWTESSGGGFPMITNEADITGVDADSGTFVTWFGGYLPANTSATDLFSQDIIVPGDATPMTVTGMIWVDSAEFLGLAFDTLALDLVDAGSGAVLEAVRGWSNLDSAAGWVAFTAPVTGSYAGQTLRLRWKADFDATDASSFLLDTLAVNTSSCP